MRRQLSERPTILVALGLIVGIVSATEIFAILLAILAVLCISALRPSLIFSAAYVIGAIVGQPSAPQVGERIWVDGTAEVVSVPRLYSSFSSAEVEVKGQRLLMSYEPALRLSLGDSVRVTGVAKPFKEGTVGKRPLHGLVGRIRPIHINKVADGPMLFRIGEAWRHSFREFCAQSLSPRTAAALEALCFNIDSALDAETVDQLQRSGTIHIISASGLHVVIFSVALALAFSTLPIPRWAQLALLTAVLIIYAGATGLRPPVIRSVIVAVAGSAAFLFRKEPDLLSALGLAASAQLLWEPSAVYDIGFQLTFIIIIAFVFYRESWTMPLNALHSTKLAARSAIRHSAIAAIAAAPIIAYAFGTLSLTSLPANMLIGLVLPVLMIVAMSAQAIALVMPTLAAGLMTLVVEPLAGWLYWVLDAFGGEWAAASIPNFSVFWVYLAYSAIIFTWRPRIRAA